MSLEKFEQVVNLYETAAENCRLGKGHVAYSTGSLALGKSIRSVRSFGYGMSPPVITPGFRGDRKMRPLIGVWGVYGRDYIPAYHIAVSDNRPESGITIHRIVSERTLADHNHTADLYIPMEEGLIISIGSDEDLLVNKMPLDALVH